MRIQTFYLINIQLDKNHKLDYKQFKNKYLPFGWEKEDKTETTEESIDNMFDNLDLFKEPVEIETMK